MQLVILSLPPPRTHTHTPRHTHTRYIPQGIDIIYSLGGGVGGFWVCDDKICLIPHKALQYSFNFPSWAVNRWSIFIVLLCTLLATTDPHSVPHENHVIPLISFTHSTQETRKNYWSPNTTVLLCCKARKERLEHEIIVGRYTRLTELRRETHKTKSSVSPHFSSTFVSLQSNWAWKLSKLG